MRTKPHELETVGIRLAIDENEIGADVAVPEILPFSGERVIGVVARQRSVGGEQRYGRRQFAVEFLSVLAGLPGLLAFVVALGRA